MGCTFSVASAASEPAAPFTGPSRLHSSPPTKAMDVIELVARARRGERTAWSTLLERYQPLVRRRCTRLPDQRRRPGRTRPGYSRRGGACPTIKGPRLGSGPGVALRSVWIRVRSTMTRCSSLPWPPAAALPARLAGSQHHHRLIPGGVGLDRLLHTDHEPQNPRQWEQLVTATRKAVRPRGHRLGGRHTVRTRRNSTRTPPLPPPNQRWRRGTAPARKPPGLPEPVAWRAGTAGHEGGAADTDEILFGIIARQAIRRGTFSSVRDLIDATTAFKRPLPIPLPGPRTPTRSSPMRAVNQTSSTPH